MFSGGCVAMRALVEDLRDGRDADYSVALTEYAHRDFSLVDVVRAGCSKGTALREWSERRGFRRDDGDGDGGQPQRSADARVRRHAGR